MTFARLFSLSPPLFLSLICCPLLNSFWSSRPQKLIIPVAIPPSNLSIRHRHPPHPDSPNPGPLDFISASNGVGIRPLRQLPYPDFVEPALVSQVAVRFVIHLGIRFHRTLASGLLHPPRFYPHPHAPPFDISTILVLIPLSLTSLVPPYPSSYPRLSLSHLFLGISTEPVGSLSCPHTPCLSLIPYDEQVCDLDNNFFLNRPTSIAHGPFLQVSK